MGCMNSRIPTQKVTPEGLPSAPVTEGAAGFLKGKQTTSFNGKSKLDVSAGAAANLNKSQNAPAPLDVSSKT